MARKYSGAKQKKADGVTLQITKLPQDIYDELKVYEARYKQEHYEVFTEAFRLLLASKQQPK